MKKIVLSLLMILVSTQVNADDLDELIDRLEKSGKLETAINKVIDERIKEQTEAKSTSSNEIKGYTEGDYILGDKKAKYSFIVYEDLECPYCKMYSNITEKIINKHNNVNVIVRDFIMPFHLPVAAKEAVLGSCVGKLTSNDEYFKYRKEIFENTKTNGLGIEYNANKINENDFKDLKNPLNNPEKMIFTIAKKISGKSINELQECYYDINTAKEIQGKIETASKNGIKGTPTTIFINNETQENEIIEGYVDEKDIEEKLNNFIKNN